MKNIVFSTTRQWNPGDEIILSGIINLLHEIIGDFNPIIFNRNPDVRGELGNVFYKRAYMEDLLRDNIKTAMFDNSIKPWMSYSFVDYIIFAGSPEWQTERCRELYSKAIEYGIPVFFIGLDTCYVGKNRMIDAVLKKAAFISVRNQDIIRSFPDWSNVHCLTCPSILSSIYEKRIKEVHTIGLIYRASENEVTCNNGWDEERYRAQMELYSDVIKITKCHVLIICHYIDEIYCAMRDFPDKDVRYSYNSYDYFQIYGECDLVLGSRIHGIGIALSMGIPCIPIKYDNRSGTIDEFFPKEDLFSGIYNENAIDYCRRNIKELNSEIVRHKKRVFGNYMSLLKDSFSIDRIDYEYERVSFPKCFFTRIYKKISDEDAVFSKSLIKEYVIQMLKQISEVIENKRVVIRGGMAY